MLHNLVRSPFQLIRNRNDLVTHISIDGNIIKQVVSTKFLGIHIDQYLTWEDHIKVISNKISKNIGIIRKIGHLFPTKVLTSLYYRLINPYLLYVNILYGNPITVVVPDA